MALRTTDRPDADSKATQGRDDVEGSRNVSTRKFMSESVVVKSL